MLTSLTLLTTRAYTPVRFSANNDLDKRREELEQLRVKQYFTNLFKANGLMKEGKETTVSVFPPTDNPNPAQKPLTLYIDLGNQYTAENRDAFLAAVIALPGLELLPGAQANVDHGAAFKINTARIPELAGLGDREITGVISMDTRW